MSRSKMPEGVAYRIETDRLLIRCWVPTDVVALRDSLDRSDGHLRPFIPFMKNEPRTHPETVELLRTLRASFDRDEHYRYAVFDAPEETLLGEVMLLDRHGDGELELGYWLDVDHTGHGYGTEASAALTRIAFELGRVDRVELQCVPANTASRALATRLGYTMEATLRNRSTYPDGVQDLEIWTLFASDYGGTLASRVELRAFDCCGERVI